MILRVVRGRGGRDQVVALGEALRAGVGSAGDGHERPERVHLGWRPASGGGDGANTGETELEVMVISNWASPEAAASADAGGTSPLSIALSRLGGVDVALFEVDETIRRRSDDAALAIRLATGRFSRPGADAEMQDLLRLRAPLIGDEMADAWVGRRLSGRAIEVTFISTWRRLPSDRALDEAFWPDIALRYDEFTVEVYSAGGLE